jgi:hypothetical protein
MLTAHDHPMMLNHHFNSLASSTLVPQTVCRRTSGSGDSNRCDMELVQRTRFGERGAFDLLVLKYQQSIIKLATRYTHNRFDAEDVAQDTFKCRIRLVIMSADALARRGRQLVVKARDRLIQANCERPHLNIL